MKGTNIEDSDMDMWIIIDQLGDETGSSSELRHALGNVKPVYLTSEKMRI